MKHFTNILFIFLLIGIISCKEDLGSNSKERVEFKIFLEPAQFYNENLPENKLHLDGWVQKAESMPIVIVNEINVTIISDSTGNYRIADSTIVDNWPISKYYIQVGENKFDGYIEIPSKPYNATINGVIIEPSGKNNLILKSNIYELKWDCKRGKSFVVIEEWEDLRQAFKLNAISENKYYLNTNFLNNNHYTSFGILTIVGPMDPFNWEDNTNYNVSNEFFKGSVISINADSYDVRLK